MKLKEPSLDLARLALSEVGYDERITGFKMQYRAGPVEVSLYSLEEILGLLQDPLSQLDFAELEEWVRIKVHDEELADRIKEQIELNSDRLNVAAQVKNLIAIRLIQCKRAV